MPAFNEARRLAEGMRRFEMAVSQGAVDVERSELLLVDDGSTDETAATAEKLLSPLPHHRVLSLPVNRGKGAAVRAGITASRGRFVAYMDADMAIDPRAVPLLLEALVDNDIAVGSRALRGSSVESLYVVRTLMGRMFNRIVTAGTGLGLRDTQCGFKAFRAPVARLLFGLLGTERFAFDVELLLRANRMGLRIAEVPVQWKHVEGSTIHPITDSMAMVADALRCRVGLVPARAVPAVVVDVGAEDGSRHVDRIRSALVGIEGRPSEEEPREPRPEAGHDHLRPDLPSDGPTDLLPAACVLAHRSEVLVLLPLEPPGRTAACCSSLRAALGRGPGPGRWRITRRMVTFRQLEAMAPLTQRVLAATSGA